MPTLANSVESSVSAARQRWSVPEWMTAYEEYLAVAPEFGGRWREAIEDMVNGDSSGDGLHLICARVRIRSKIRLLCELREAGLLHTNPRPGWYPRSGYEADAARR